MNLKACSNGFALVLRACICMFLVITGFSVLFITSKLPEYNYHIEFSNNILFSIFALAVALAVAACLYVAYRLLLSRNISFYAVMFAASFLFSFLWSIMASVWMEWDPRSVYNAALELGNPGSIFYMPGQYLSRFPYQIPLVLIFRLYLKIFGTSGIYVALEFTNAICNSITVVLLAKTASAISDSARTGMIAACLSALFFPLFFYSTFAYGNLLSFPFCFGALYLQITGIKANDAKNQLVAALLICISILIKSTNLLFLVAMLVVWGVVILRDKNLASLISAAIAIVLLVANNALVDRMASSLGLNPSQEMPKTAVIAMGLQEDGSDPLSNNKGWYNGYLWSWSQEEYSAELAKEDSISSIRDSVNHFVRDPGYAADFFIKKYLSEWTEPTYESLLCSNWSHESGQTEFGVMSERPMTRLLHSVYYGHFNEMIIAICKGLQLCLLLFSTGYFLFDKNRTRPEYYAPALLAAGSAVFYLIWEAQAQYVMPAYMCLIPYAAASLSLTVDCIEKKIKTKEAGR